MTPWSSSPRNPNLRKTAGVREALDLVEKIWRLVSIEEFVREGRALKAEEEKQWKRLKLSEHEVVPLKPEERQVV